jgi:hypothetical protein
MRYRVNIVTEGNPVFHFVCSRKTWFGVSTIVMMMIDIICFISTTFQLIIWLHVGNRRKDIYSVSTTMIVKSTDTAGAMSVQSVKTNAGAAITLAAGGFAAAVFLV